MIRQKRDEMITIRATIQEKESFELFKKEIGKRGFACIQELMNSYREKNPDSSNSQRIDIDLFVEVKNVLGEVIKCDGLNTLSFPGQAVFIPQRYNYSDVSEALVHHVEKDFDFSLDADKKDYAFYHELFLFYNHRLSKHLVLEQFILERRQSKDPYEPQVFGPRLFVARAQYVDDYLDMCRQFKRYALPNSLDQIRIYLSTKISDDDYTCLNSYFRNDE